MKYFALPGNNRIKKILARIISAVLLTIMVGGLTYFPVQAADDKPQTTTDRPEKVGTAVSNAYILEVTTGVKSGKDIKFFIIKYKTKDKNYPDDPDATITKTKYIMPQEDSLALGKKEVATYGSDLDQLKTIQNKLGYTLQYAFDKTKIDKDGTPSGLRQYKTDQYYFTLSDPITEVVSIDAFAGTQTEWTCQGLRLFSVSELYGLRMAGVWSDDWYVDFKGPMITMMKTNQKTWSTKGANLLHMNTKATFQKQSDFKGLPYENHGTQEYREYGFAISMADTYKAGFDSLYAAYKDGKKAPIDMELAEELTVNVTYTDIYGETRFEHFPMITSSVMWLNNNSFSEPVHAIGAEGGTIAFTGEIPDCEKITGVSISFGSSRAVQDGFIVKTGNKSRRDERIAAGDKEEIMMQSFVIYDLTQNTESHFKPYTEGAVLRYELNAPPILFTLSGDTAGDRIVAGTLTTLGLRAYTDQTLTREQVLGEAYLFEIETDNVGLASPTSDVSIRIKYTNNTGSEKEAGPYLLKDLTNEYYGYWPGSVDSFPYRYGISKGHKLTFVLRLNNVKELNGAIISIDNSAKDDYQIKSFKAYSLSTLGDKVIVWNKMDNGSGVVSNLAYDRTYKGKSLAQSDAALNIAGTTGPVLIQPGKSQMIDFETNSVAELEEDKFDYTDFSISYDEAMKNFGFTKTRRDYKLTIWVADDAVGEDGGVASSVHDTDAGSENLFYFQLVFEYGESAVVQANQQILGDRFQSGVDHEITISVNADYGEVVSIRVIPDDLSDDSKKYDKLNIEKLTVVDADTKGTHRTWEVTSVGWVGIDYTEDSEKTSATGKAGRSMQEIAKTYTIDYVTNQVEIEIALRTGVGDKSTNLDDNGKEVYTYKDQFKGSMKALVYYINNSGQEAKPIEVDFVKAMYEYMNKQAPASSSKGVVSDPTKMFREGHTDRFIISIPDVKSITAFELEITPAEKSFPYIWNLCSLTGKIVSERGNLRINTNDEYEYEYPKQAEMENANGNVNGILFTQTASGNPAYSQYLSETNQPLYITVTENVIQFDEERKVAKTAVSRVPASRDDTLNVYVFPKISGISDKIDQYDLSCDISYEHPLGIFKTGTDTMNKVVDSKGDVVTSLDNEEGLTPMFYYFGLEAPLMSDLNHITFKAKSTYANMALLDYAIVQQVRSGTVIATYYVKLSDTTGDAHNAVYPKDFYPTRNNSTLSYSEQQEVTIQLGMGTDSKSLYPENMDIGVSIDYKASYDPNGMVFHSPVVYLTDQKVNKIREGQVVDLSFKESFIGEITGINIFASGGLNVYVDSACIGSYHVDKAKNKEMVGWYSFGNGMKLAEAPMKMTMTANERESVDVVMPLSMSFTTASPATSYESGTVDPVKAIITLNDMYGNPIPVQIADLRKYLVDGSGNFKTGKTQEVRMLVAGGVGIRKINIEPRNGSGTAGWSIESASATMGEEYSGIRTVADRIYEGSPRNIIFANITVSAKVAVYNQTTKVFNEKAITNGEYSVISPSGQPIYIMPTANGSDEGCKVTAVEVSGDDYVSDNMTECLSQDGARVKFLPPENHSGKTKYYRLTAESNETPDAKVIVKITIESVPIEEGNTTVPDVVGISKLTAQNALENAGLVVAYAEEQYSDTAPTNTVISIDPGANKVVPKGTTVTVVISKGKAPAQVNVPNVYGMDENDAISAITDAGLRYQVISREYNDGAVTKYPAGTVMMVLVNSNEVAPGATLQVEENTLIQLVISLGPAPTDDDGGSGEGGSGEGGEGGEGG
ncbi:MAG: PASTA domain-containing protein [Lachnospiraceae bacterium]|nr:PASTA domain-containing protein [Lachnospiraceae bacterium]